MKQLKHLMLDIETMGNESFSSILSIGAVEFDIETGETGKEFYVTIDLQSTIDAGLQMNPSTVMWWMKQSDEARKSLMNENNIKLEEALNAFSEFCTKDYEIWGNSARFDCGILQNAYNILKMDIPWDFRKERCLRTLTSFAPKIRANYEFNGVMHNALHDCKYQIGYGSEIWKTLNTNDETI